MTDRAYCRVSLDSETSGSIDKQQAQLLKVSADPVWYIDRSVSGATPFAEREGGGRLLADLASGDRVMITKIDRAARNVEDFLGFVKKIKAAGASLLIAEQNIDTAGPIGDLLLTILAAVAQFERDLIAERRRESLAVFKEEGRHAVGRAPFGLLSVPNPSGRGLVLRPHPEEAPLLRDVVERLLAGETQASLAPRLGLKEAGFSRLLRNERLAGVYTRDEAGAPRIDPDAAVFSLSEWRALQEFLDQRPAKSWARTEGYGPALECVTCGGRLYLSRAKAPRKDTYKCLRRGRHERGEPAASVTAAAADFYLEAEFLRRFGDEPVVEEITVSSDAVRDEAIAVARMRLDHAKRALDDAATDEEEDAAYAAHKSAKQALRAADALPSEVVTEARDLGMNHRELWEMLPDSEKVAYVAAAGRWVVATGKAPLEEKITFIPR